LSLLLVLYSAPRGFSPGTSTGFPLSSKTNSSKFQFDLDVRHLSHEPLAPVIVQALPVFDVKFTFTFFGEYSHCVIILITKKKWMKNACAKCWYCACMSSLLHVYVFIEIKPMPFFHSSRWTFKYKLNLSTRTDQRVQEQKLRGKTQVCEFASSVFTCTAVALHVCNIIPLLVVYNSLYFLAREFLIKE